jgi:hypothetical protein
MNWMADAATAAAGGIPAESVGIIIGAVVVALTGGGVGGALLGRRLRTNTEITPQPLQVQQVGDLATQDDLKGLERRIDRKLEKLETALTGERSVAREANGNLHKRIDGLANAVSTMTGELKGVSRLIESVHTHCMEKNGVCGK